MHCSAFRYLQHQQGKNLSEQQPCLKPADGHCEVPVSQVSSSSGGSWGFPTHSDGLLNSKFILHREEERIWQESDGSNLIHDLNLSVFNYVYFMIKIEKERWDKGNRNYTALIQRLKF